MNKPKPVWKGVHAPAVTTDELMQTLQPYESRRQTSSDWMNRFQDQERRYYRNEEEMFRQQSQNVNQKRQMETLANPDEAVKINRLKKELSTSRDLTEV